MNISKLPKSILQIVTIALIGLNLSNCNSQSHCTILESYSDNYTKKSIITENEIATAQKDIYSDYQKFVRESYAQLMQNKLSILKLKDDLNGNGFNHSGFSKSEIEDLNMNNNTLKKQLDEYVENGSGNWQTFESKFCSGLTALAEASSNPIVMNK
jgi:hypothetical protein